MGFSTLAAGPRPPTLESLYAFTESNKPPSIMDTGPLNPDCRPWSSPRSACKMVKDGVLESKEDFEKPWPQTPTTPVVNGLGGLDPNKEMGVSQEWADCREHRRLRSVQVGLVVRQRCRASSADTLLQLVEHSDWYMAETAV